ncbi:MAG: proprotein convertase P-domain-containing protein [Deltaproteobacteria bacterium]|nr:proprotein convertase P-domain-containing protein [Deltaproteobacteria bacterium]
MSNKRELLTVLLVAFTLGGCADEQVAQLDSGRQDAVAADLGMGDGHVTSDAPGFDGRSVDGQPVDGRSVDGQALDGQALDGQALDAQPTDGAAGRGTLPARGIGAINCVGVCGRQAAVGCYCDALCVAFNDCCPDKALVCDYELPDCFGHCGGRHPQGCYCDAECTTFEDCCPGRVASCANDTSCSSTQTCTLPARCVGIPADLSIDKGRCVDTSTLLPGVGEDCDELSPCGPFLICVGDMSFSTGSCAPQWMGQSYLGAGEATITDDGVLLEQSVVVFGLASVPVDIIVHLSIEHARPADLSIELEDPNGVVSSVWEHLSDDPLVVRLSVRGNPLDDTINGRWTLRIKDTVAGEVGQLRSWTLEINSRWD